MRTRVRGVVVGGVVLGLVGGGVSAAGATEAAGAASASVREDFNGDGHQDLVTIAPGGSAGGQAGAGYIVVSYGSASGIGAGSRTYIGQDSAGVPGAPEADDRFGQKVVARDFDGDGISDLAVESAGERDEVADVHGAVTILWGRAGGLSGDGAVNIAAPVGGGQVGDDLVGGDFNGDGHDDLVMQRSGDWEMRAVLAGPFSRDGVPASEQQVDMFTTDNDIFALTAGDMTGDGIDDLATFYAYQNHAEGGRFWRGTESGLSTRPTALDSAATATVGDFDKDGIGDLATRTVLDGITENIPYDAGTIKVYYGTSAGPGAGRFTTITQNTAGVPGVSEEGDQFGARLDAGDVNGDGYPDLAVGVPFEAIGSKAAAGSVVLLKGRSGGLSGTGAQAFHQDTSGIPGVAEANDRFGGAVRLLDVTKDGRAELAVSAPQENNTGAVWSLRGVSGGLAATGSTAFDPVDLGTPATKALFGSAFGNESGTYLYPAY